MRQLRARPVAWIAAVALAASVVWAFFAATTVHGDDHVFLAFARYASNPLVAFVRDQHGGEFYRPLPMLLWWLAGRLGAGTAPALAVLAFSLHAGVSVLVFALGRALGQSPRAALIAAALFLLSPATREAASWFSASTDLLATIATLGAVLLLLRRRPLASLVVAGAAYLSKESAIVLPALLVAALLARRPRESWPRIGRAVVPHVVLAAVYVGVRVLVLARMGGSGDQVAPLLGKLLQIASGIVHCFTAPELLPEGLAWALGSVALALVVFSAVRAARAGEPGALVPLGWTVLAAAPLLAAAWVVGARYFYLPAVGLAWLCGQALARRAVAGQVLAVAAVAVLGLAHAVSARQDVVRYDERVAAARSAVLDGARQGRRVFHVAGGIKDVDLAVKESPELAPFASELLVLGDVPASFVALTPSTESRARFLFARPPLPPSGAYVFGDHRVVGLARRDDSPDLGEVVELLPDIRFIRLSATERGSGRITWRDATTQVVAALRDSD